MSQSLYSPSLTQCSHTLSAYIRDTPDESSGRIKRYFQDFVSALIPQPSHVHVRFNSVESIETVIPRVRPFDRRDTTIGSILNGTLVHRSIRSLPNLHLLMIRRTNVKLKLCVDAEKAQRRNVTSCLHAFTCSIVLSFRLRAKFLNAHCRRIEDVTGRGKKERKKKKKKGEQG